ncbi:hypothetical protein [Streptomyces sp. NPDC026673]|uniref:hypothetical protein n=1 Tax=Streptomyces sp. NPDC026673 TaxID=3155724 RepID=UPI00340C6CF9
MAITAATGTLALGLAACGGSADEGAKAKPSQSSAKSEKKEVPPAEALRAATKAAVEQAAAKVAVDSVDPKEGNTKAEGTLSWKKGSEGAELSMDPGSDADMKDMAGEDGKVHMTITDGAVYLPIEGEMAAAANGKKWLKFDATAAEDNPAKDMPHGPVQALAALSIAGDLAKAGEEQVDGAQATHYTGTVDIAKFAADSSVLDLITKDERDAYVAELKDTGIKNSVKIEAWVGADDLTVKTMESGSTAKGPAKLTITYSDYGQTSAVTVPPAKDVTTLAEMLKSAAQG